MTPPAADSCLSGTAALAGFWLAWEKRIKFILVGVWNTAFGYLAFLFFYALSRRFGLHYLCAMVAAQLVSVANAYLGYRKLVFKSSGAVAPESLRFGAVYAYTFAFNAAALPFLVRLGWNPAVAQAAILFVSALASWFGHSRWSFRSAA